MSGMSSNASREDARSEAGSCSVPLEEMFSHPAGLRTARHICQTLWDAMKSRPPTHNTFQAVSPTMLFNSSVEIRTKVDGILTFNPEPATRRQGAAQRGVMGYPNRTEGSRDAARDYYGSRPFRSAQAFYCPSDVGIIPARSSDATLELPSHVDAFPPLHRRPNAQAGTSIHPPKDTQIGLNVPIAVNTSLSCRIANVPNLSSAVWTSVEPSPGLQGTESPYRVESPSIPIPNSASNTPPPANIRSTDRSALQLPSISNISPLAPPEDATVLAPLTGFKPVNKAHNTMGSSNLSPMVQHSPARPTSLLSARTIASSSIASKALVRSSSPPRTTATNIRPLLPYPPSYNHNTATTNNNDNNNDNNDNNNDNNDNNDNNHNNNNNNHNNNNTSSSQKSSHPLQYQHRTTPTAADMPPKRKIAPAGGDPSAPKKQKTNRPPRKAVEKKPKPVSGAWKLNSDMILRILEFCPPSVNIKMRCVSRHWRDLMTDGYSESFARNQRLENYGPDMPDPPEGLTERLYINLLGAKGCMEKGCENLKASRTHWSWAKRWCTDCWLKKIEREDRLKKIHQNNFAPRVIEELMKCIPAGMHDSYMKPHDYDAVETNGQTPNGPRLYTYHLKSDLDEIIVKYTAFLPPPHEPDMTKTDADRIADRAIYDIKVKAAETERDAWAEEMKEKMSKHMDTVKKIEAAVRAKRKETRDPYDKNRAARKELFTNYARRELPHISVDFIHTKSKSYKAATRIFRDPGTERGWQSLKPKIEKEYEAHLKEVQKEVEEQETAKKEAAAKVASEPERLVSSSVPIEDNNDYLAASILSNSIRQQSQDFRSQHLNLVSHQQLAHQPVYHEPSLFRDDSIHRHTMNPTSQNSGGYVMASHQLSYRHVHGMRPHAFPPTPQPHHGVPTPPRSQHSLGHSHSNLITPSSYHHVRNENAAHGFHTPPASAQGPRTAIPIASLLSNSSSNGPSNRNGFSNHNLPPFFPNWNN